MVTFGQRVKEARQRTGLTVEAAAQKACMTPLWWEMIEDGRANPDSLPIMHVVAISYATEVTLEEAAGWYDIRLQHLIRFSSLQD